MEIKKVQIHSSKGNLSTVIHYPEGRTELLAILCPGYLDTKDYKNMSGLANELCAKGYTAVRFDPTGTWESAGNNSDYTTTQCLKDIKNTIDYMTKDRDYKHILVAGHSRGGEISILYAARDPRVSAVLALMPSSEREPMLSKRIVEWKATDDRISYRDLPYTENQKQEFHIPFSYVKDLNKYDVMEDVKKVKAPLILIAGELDDKCTPESIQKIFLNANEPKRFVIIPSIGHDYRHNAEEVKLVNGSATKLLADMEPKRNRSKT